MCASELAHFDASPTLWVQRLPLFGLLFRGRFLGRRFPVFPPNVEYGDIVHGLPVHPDSCRAVYCSHVLEHLTLNEFRVALRNTYSYLKPGGIFRFVLPDLKKLAEDYLESSAVDASITFMEQSHLGKKRRPSNPLEFAAYWLGHSGHSWMWDSSSVSSELEKVGFKEVRRAQFGDSEDPHFSHVEDFERWKGALGVECVK